MQPVSPSAAHYDRRTVWLHWATAILVVLQWFSGQTIDWFPRGPLRVDARSVHILMGALLLMVLLVRLVWRATGGRRLPASDPGPLHVLAKATHWGLYLLLAAVLGLGVFLAWVRGDSIFTWFTIPPYDPSDKAVRPVIEWRHINGANLVMIIAFVHAVAALIHRYVWHDGVLARMRPTSE